jgi:hypothetical protein
MAGTARSGAGIGFRWHLRSVLRRGCEAVGEWSSDEINAHFAEKTFACTPKIQGRSLVDSIPESMRDRELELRTSAPMSKMSRVAGFERQLLDLSRITVSPSISPCPHSSLAMRDTCDPAAPDEHHGDAVN